MSSDRKDSDVVWPGSTPLPWDQSSNQPAPSPSEDATFASEAEHVPNDVPFDPEAVASFDEEAAIDDSDIEEEEVVDIDVEKEESEQIETADPSSSSPLKQLWYYITLLIFPLLFAGITALLVLPPVATGRANVSSGALIPILAVLLVLALLQSGLVYYLRNAAHAGLFLSAGGLLFYLVIGCFALFGPIASLVLLVAASILVVYIVRRYMHPVPEGYVDIVMVKGKYSRTLFSGINLLLPWEEVKAQVNVEEIHWNCPPQKIQLSEDTDVVLRALVSYQVIPHLARNAVTTTNNWEENLRNLLISTIQTVATTFVPSDFLSWQSNINAHTYQGVAAAAVSPFADDFVGSIKRRDRINNYIVNQVRRVVTSWGVQINWVSIRDVELAPHGVAIVEREPALADMYYQLPDDSPTELFTPTPEPVTVANGQTTSSNGTTPAPAKKPVTIPKEEVLVKAYKEIQNGKITDPIAIRHIADTFQAVADDAEASNKVSFDAARAAQNLYKQAQKYEELLNPNVLHNDATRPDILNNPNIS